MRNRRDFLKNSMLSAGLLSLSSASKKAFATAAGPADKPPMRFIFVHKGNGLLPHTLAPPTLSQQEQAKENAKEAFEVDLDKHDLPAWMSPLANHKENLTILQGLSGKMCTTGHHTWQSSLGVYKANEQLSSIKWATVDFELAKLFPSPLEHIELACFPNSGGNSRGNINGIEKGFSARGPQQPNYAFGSPKVAMQELFKSVSSNEDERVRYQLERKVLEFAVRNHAGLGQDLRELEQVKVQNYTDSIEAVRERNRKIEALGDVIRQHVPRLDQKYFAEDISTIDRQVGHTEILLATLISGMTNVVTFTVDELGTTYTGIPGIEGEAVNLHDVGHGKPVGSVKAEDVRQSVRHQHMKVISTIVERLKSVPEAGGTMFDNTTLLYFPDNGETHHSTGVEWPFIVLAGKNSQLELGRRYIRLPQWGKQGHKTLGNWYTTILNAYGNPIRHYGSLDVGLNKFNLDQTGPIERFLA